ncbi:MAG: sulfur carrier protein ThiS [Polyangia bacterium]|jgi:thiamine biosynthesis protein ThiS|nr:sulfur carrier protein ThiS [Polyangia bacterium]
MSITVNGEEHPFRPGLTVEALMEERKFSFPLKTVLVNGVLVPRSEHPARELADGDRVEVIHMISGG